jgi:hypothetical protein
MNNRPVANTSPTAATHGNAVKSVASAGTPEALASPGTLAVSVLIVPKRGNSNPVWIGSSSTNDAPSVKVTDVGVLLQAPPGKRLDLCNIFVDVTTNGEGVAYETLN